MASIPQQGTYLGTTLIGFTAFPAGLLVFSSHSGLGVVLTIAGLALLAYSAVGFYRIKNIGFSNR